MAAWNIVKTFWNHVFEEYSLCLNALQWSPSVQLLINAIASKTRKEMINLIERNYTDLSTSRLAELMGIAEKDIIPCKIDRPLSWTLVVQSICLSQVWRNAGGRSWVMLYRYSCR